MVRLSGIKSKIDTLNMTPEAKARAHFIMLFLFPLMKINKEPIMVDNPAIKHNRNGNMFVITPHLF